MYDGGDAIRMKKTEKKKKKKNKTDNSGETKGDGPRSPSSGKYVTVHPIATVKGSLQSSTGAEAYYFDFGPKGLLVRGDVKHRLVSPWTLPGKKYDASFM